MSTSWKQLIIEAKELTKDNGKNAWRLAQVIRDLSKNGDFLSDACKGDLHERDSQLDVFSQRFGLNVIEMIQMIEHFPNLSDWADGRFRILSDKTARIIQQKAFANQRRNNPSTSPVDHHSTPHQQITPFSPVAESAEPVRGEQAELPLDQPNAGVVAASKYEALLEKYHAAQRRIHELETALAKTKRLAKEMELTAV